MTESKPRREAGSETIVTPRVATDGYPPLYALSTLFFLLALGGVVVLVVTDLQHHYRPSAFHNRLDAWPLMAIGLSTLAMQLGTPGKRADRIKGMFLGVAFLLWGGEQLLPASPAATFMDEGAVTIFVVDVSFIIWARLSLSDPPEPAQRAQSRDASSDAGA